MDGLMRTDQEYAKSMADASARLLNGILLLRGEWKHKVVAKSMPKQGLVWHGADYRQIGPRSESDYAVENRRKNERARLEKVNREELAEANRTSRDPCKKCGVRGDYGCKHQTKYDMFSIMSNERQLTELNNAFEREVARARKDASRSGQPTGLGDVEGSA